VPGKAATTHRLKLGDRLEGFELSRIEERKVSFTDGKTTVEIALDDFRRAEGLELAAGTRPPSPTRPPR
jgi:hypothetical protein